MIEINNNIEIVEDDKKEINKINNKVYNIDSNTYENIIYNKKEIAINLFNKLDKGVLSINESIIRNYLVKCVVYKLYNKILEIRVNQGNLLVSFHKCAKEFDIEQKLEERKGYENDSICYSMYVEDDINCEYVINIVKKIYDYFTKPKENMADKLFDILKFKICTISESITFHNTNKGLMFKDKRNFVIISKTNYGVYLRLLNIEDKEHILNVVTHKTYEPLCLSYRVKELSDIDVILPLIENSYEINKINPIDLKHKFYEIYS